MRDPTPGAPPARRGAFGARLRELRAERGLTQQQIADAAGTDRKTINRIERASHATHLDQILLLADALGVPPGALFGPPARLRALEQTRRRQ